MPGLDALAYLIPAAFAAGLIDAIAGGGGLIVLPALLMSGLGPVEALATAKLQGTFGTAAATWAFLRRGAIDLRKEWPVALATFIAAGAGTATLMLVDPEFLAAIVPVLLAGAALWLAFSPRAGDTPARARLPAWATGFLVCPLIGFYDGFFGPGTGSFFALTGVALAGLGLAAATAKAKLLNFVSNLAALLAFILGGHVVWTIGLAMALAQIAGATLGARLAYTHGAPLIRPVLVVVALCLAGRLAFDAWAV